jgi:hypothetical protein
MEAPVKDRYAIRDRIAALDPERDHAEIYRLLQTIEFPWDMFQALTFALFRTYAVPSIGRLLKQSGEFARAPQRRFDDTVLILEAILEHGMDSAIGRAALRRMNQMHGRFPIRNDDLRYVLAAFVVTPARWLDDYGWRRLTFAEREACAVYYRELGRRMGIKDIPADFTDFTRALDRYEAEHFHRDADTRVVADHTLALLATLPPYQYLPGWMVRRLARALMDAPLRNAFGYPAPTRGEVVLARAGLRWRGRVVRRWPPRQTPFYPRQRASIRSYPDGYDVAALGTFAD